MSSEYPDQYENGSNGQNYKDPYGTNNGSYGGSNEYNNQPYEDVEGYGSENSYGAFSDSSYGERYDGHARSAEQEERDRLQRKNRSERRRDVVRDDRRERDYRDHRDRGHDSRYSDRDRDRDRRERDFEERAGEKWISGVPTNTVILRGLPQSIIEQDILAELQMFGAPIRELRLMRKSSGASRGFAFVEFQNKDDAVRWMDANQRKLVVQNRYSCTMDFSTQKDPKNYYLHRMDWNCSKCGVHNFKRRDYCFKCNMSRYESGQSQTDGFDHVGTNPCNTLLFRGLDALTSEENLTRALTAVMPMTCKNIQVIRDVTTGVSHGYAFVELSSVGESMSVFDALQAMSPALEVDGKQILVSFAKNTFATSIATITAAAAAASQGWDPASECYKNYDGSYYSDQYYEGYDYSKYPAESGYAPTATKTTDATNAAAAVAQNAIQQAQAAKNYHKQIQQQKKIAEMSTDERLAQQAQAWKQMSKETTAAVPSQEVIKYSPPDVTLYQYDETSGYYYDPVTTLYYDANTQYYYNSQTSQFLYWDAEQSTYLPAPTSKEESSGDKSEDKKEEKKEGKDKKEKVKIAKKIAKDMAKWAKSLNAQKEAIKDGIKKNNIPNLAGKKESTTADAGFAILEKLKNAPSENMKLMPPPTMPITSAPTAPERAKPGLVASYGDDSDEDEDDNTSRDPIDESKLVDLTKMACLLCKRQFQGKDQLTRHTQMSDLHKQNLQKLQQSSDNGQAGASGMQYRDRAKERRDKIGSIAPPARKRPLTPEPFEQPTKAGIGEDNIGSKLLQKMGWSSGQGLGKSGQGIVSPIEAERRNVTAAGLGMGGTKANIEDSDNYKVALKKTLFARYKDLD